MAAIAEQQKEKPPPPEAPETKGWLYKWTNYIKGYQKRWFVLSNGLLSYYRNQAEMAHTCRGTISLHGAIIHTETYSCNFVVSNGGGTQTFHLRASSEKERQTWVTALEMAKAKAIQMMESDDEEEGTSEHEFPVEIGKQELITAIRTMASKLEILQTCNDLIVKHGHALQKSVGDLEAAGAEVGQNSRQNSGDSHVSATAPKLGILNERATLFKITSNAMINASHEYLELTQTQGRKWQRLLGHEREQRLRLEEMVEQLARQLSHLEAQVRGSSVGGSSNQLIPGARVSSNTKGSVSSPAVPPAGGEDIRRNSTDNKILSASTSDDDDDFQDAVDEPELEFQVRVPRGHIRSVSMDSKFSNKSENNNKPDMDEDEFSSDQEDPNTIINVIQMKTKDEVDGKSLSSGPTTPVHRKSSKTRRSRIPDKPDISFSLWSIMKNCIGKDLSKIPVPVNFSEPISFLQRLNEDFEYSEILDKAAACSDNYEEMAYVSAFTVSSYATSAIRTGKPFNPLLGETYECDRRDDLGWKCVAEQVMHHPPMVAQYCQGNAGWKCWQEFTMRSKFKGKYLEIEPIGITHLEFSKSGNHYTWRKVKTIVHNIVIGKLWIDNCGEMELINHTTNDKCYMKFEPYSYFGGTPKKVTGTINSTSGKVEWVLNGTWDTKMEGSKVIGESSKGGKQSLEIGVTKTLWKRNPIAPEADKYYMFTKFACELNETEDGVAPTDSRLRPDQRLMENGKWEEANSEKVRLEEKQRAVRRKRELEKELAQQEGREFKEYEPLWFKRVEDVQAGGGKVIHAYSGNYWESKDKQDWKVCPEIF